MGMHDYESHQYPEFSQSLKARFASVVGNGSSLFTTDAAGLFDVFLANLPELFRRHYTCHACRHFVDRFGGLVSIAANGEVVAALWDDKAVPEFFREAVAAVAKAVLKAKVTGVFISDYFTLGTPVTGEWEHMSVTLPAQMVFTTGLKTAGQRAAERHEEFLMLTSALLEYPADVADKAVTLLKSEALYRSDKVLGVAEWFKALQERLDGTKDSKKKTNVKWLAVATAPVGFCHVKSSMIGTLLDDLKAGMTVDAVSRRFAEKMSPGNYMRAQVAPSQGNIEQAEKIVEKLGLANSLKRRYAQFEEIPHFLWQDRGAVRKAEVKQAGGVFANIAPKGAPAPDETMTLPSTTMTWEKFQRTVLPTAETIEAKMDNPNRLMALVTASDPTAPNILQWDNLFSWYYHGGIDGEIKRRVEGAGGRYENNEIRCSLIWEGHTDLDLHCVTPNGAHIYYARRSDYTDGCLDVDANGQDGLRDDPVENIRWGEGKAPSGSYRFYVHNYYERGKGPTPFRVELEINGRVYTFSGVAGRTNWQTDVFTFNHVKGQQPSIANTGHYASDDAWSVPAGGFVKVKGVTESPNLWGEAKVAHAGHHVFFLLDGCKDLSEGKGRGFFNEMLKPDLREIRKTLEAYTANTSIEGADSASACGVGYSKDSEWNLTLKVTATNSTRLIKIDRWD